MKRTFVFEDKYWDIEAIKRILGKIPEIQFVGGGTKIVTVGQGLEACAALKPDLIIADGEISSDRNAGANFVRQIKSILPDVRILGMTRYEDCRELLQRAGCDFVVNKDLIENDAEAEKYFRETFIPKPQHFLDTKPVSLTPEEEKVLRLIRDGNTEDAIAQKMGFGSRKPVRHIKDALFGKFGAVNIANLIDAAYRSGNLKPDQ